MNIGILGENLPIILAMIVSTSVIYIILRLNKKWRNKYLLVLIALGIIGAITIRLIVGRITDSPIPNILVVMIFPTTFAFYLFLIVVIHGIKLKTVSVLMLICSVLFSLVLINGYYSYFPTLYSVVNKNDIKALSEQRQVLTKYSGTSSSMNQVTIESSLGNIGQTTNGTVYSLNIPGTVSKFKARTAYVYVPAIASGAISLPVIVLTTGYPGQVENWLDSGIVGILNDFAQTHKGITPYIFMVDNTGSVTNDTECVNSPRGNVETYLTVDVPNYIKSHFNVESGPNYWAIGGLSMGGMCSIMLTLRHPNVYHYFLDIAGELGPEVGSKQETIAKLFGGSETEWAAHQPSLLLDQHNYPQISGFFGVGKNDDPVVTTAISQLYEESVKAKLNVLYESIQGEHTFNVWEQNFTDALPWISNQLGATQCETSCYQ
jgi:S-formylglutathione hydrolase FrmB